MISYGPTIAQTGGASTYKVGICSMCQLLFGSISKGSICKSMVSKRGHKPEHRMRRRQSLEEVKQWVSGANNNKMNHIPGANELARTVLMSGAFPAMFAIRRQSLMEEDPI